MGARQARTVRVVPPTLEKDLKGKEEEEKKKKRPIGSMCIGSTQQRANLVIKGRKKRKKREKRQGKRMMMSD